MTTRTAASAFFIAGTNRAMFRFTMINFMCRDLEQLQDSSLPPGSDPAGRQPFAGWGQQGVPQ